MLCCKPWSWSTIGIVVSFLVIGIAWDGATFVGSFCDDDDGGSTNELDGGDKSVDCCFDGKDGDSFQGATKLLVAAPIDRCLGCCWTPLGTSVLVDAGGVSNT